MGLHVAFGDKNSTARIDRLAISPELDLFWRLWRLCEGFNFKSGLFRDRIGDRIAGAVEYNLFDIDAKFGDVEPLERVLATLSLVV